MKASIRLLFITFYVWLFIIHPASADEQHITTIEPQNIPAEQLAKIIKPQLSPASSVNVYQNTLILNATDEELANIRQILARIDTAGRQLLISIRKTGDSSQSQHQGQVTIQRQQDPVIKIGKDNNLRINSETHTTATISRQSIGLSGVAKQSIRATEGLPVFISTGNTRLLRKTGDNGEEWVSADNGFYATAWINGNSVTVKIEQRDNRFENSTTISNQQLQTQVNGQAGQWLPIGMINEQDSSVARQINSADRKLSGSSQSIFLKIEPLD